MSLLWSCLFTWFVWFFHFSLSFALCICCWAVTVIDNRRNSNYDRSSGRAAYGCVATIWLPGPGFTRIHLMTSHRVWVCDGRLWWAASVCAIPYSPTKTDDSAILRLWPVYRPRPVGIDRESLADWAIILTSYWFPVGHWQRSSRVHAMGFDSNTVADLRSSRWPLFQLTRRPLSCRIFCVSPLRAPSSLWRRNRKDENMKWIAMFMISMYI